MYYLGQALLKVRPEVFLGDLFFAYGSQDQFSIYSTFYSWAAGIVGWSALAPALTIVFHLAFLLALVLVLRELVPMPLVALGLVVAAVSPFYGGYSVFSFGEAFLTARTLTEPLILFAVLCMIKERYAFAFGLCIAALFIHPLVAVVGFGMLFVLLAERHRRVWWLLLLIPVGIVLALLGVPGFELLARRYDADWYAALSWNLFALPEYWRGQDWARVVFDAAILWLAVRLASPNHARLLRSLLFVAVIALLVTVVGAGIMWLQVVTQVQLWRTQWLAHLLACGLFPWVIWRLRDRGPALWLGLTLVVAALSFRDQSNSLWVMSFGVLALFGAWNNWQASTRGFVGFVVIAGFSVFVAGLVNELFIVDYFSKASYTDSVQERVRRMFGMTMLVFVMMSGCVLVALRFPRVLGAAMVIALGALAIEWDQRTEWRRYLDQNVAVDHVFARHIPNEAQVYWIGELGPTWFMLKRRSYFSTAQGSGVLFNRDNAIEFKRRHKLVEPLESQVSICLKIASMLSSCTPQRSSIESVCASVGGPDFIILKANIDNLFVDRWRKKFSDGDLHEYFLYDCSKLKLLADVRPTTKPAKKT